MIEYLVTQPNICRSTPSVVHILLLHLSLRRHDTQAVITEDNKAFGDYGLLRVQELEVKVTKQLDCPRQSGCIAQKVHK